jgi:hypothetical protein
VIRVNLLAATPSSRALDGGIADPTSAVNTFEIG